MARKVLRPFFCRETGVKYHKGDVYNGDRKDIESYLEPIKKEKKERKPRQSKKES